MLIWSKRRTAQEKLDVFVIQCSVKCRSIDYEDEKNYSHNLNIFKDTAWDFPVGPGVKNPPASAGDMA